MKHKDANILIKAGKKQQMHLREGESVSNQAGEYLLVTADELTPVWNIGTIRPINEAHKQSVYRNFVNSGVLRQDATYRLQVTCTKA
jgi:hypothetical protein